MATSSKVIGMENYPLAVAMLIDEGRARLTLPKAERPHPRHQFDVYAEGLMRWLEDWRPGQPVDESLNLAHEERPDEFVALYESCLDTWVPPLLN